MNLTPELLTRVLAIGHENEGLPIVPVWISVDPAAVEQCQDFNRITHAEICRVFGINPAEIEPHGDPHS